jgi:hypothetical protein
MNTPLLTRQQLSLLLGRSTRQLDRDRAAGLVLNPVTKPPKNPRWLAAEVHRWIAAGLPTRDQWDRIRSKQK